MAVRKGRWRKKLEHGVAIGLGTERMRDGGIRTQKTGWRNRIAAVLKGQELYRTGIDPLDSLDSLDSLDFLDSLDSLDTDPNTDSDNDQTHRKPLPKGDVGDT